MEFGDVYMSHMNIVNGIWNKIYDFIILTGRKYLPIIFYKKYLINGKSHHIVRYVTKKEVEEIKSQFHQQQKIEKLYPKVKS
jgi:hypothetical protein